MKNQTLTVALFIGLSLLSCKKKSIFTTEDDEETVEIKLDSKVEIEKWKTELIENKLIGYPCNNSINDSQWSSDNPDQSNGLPEDNNNIKNAMVDFDQDGKQDLLLYFKSENCIGKKSETPSFAKIVYAVGKSNSEVISEITTAILNEYNLERGTNKTLKETNGEYLNTTTTITFEDGMIKGEFKMFTKGDAHCCPSYNGKYTYNPFDKKASIEIIKLKK